MNRFRNFITSANGAIFLAAAGLIAWIMSGKFQKNPFKVVRESAWTTLGVICMVAVALPVLVFVLVRAWLRAGGNDNLKAIAGTAVLIGVAVLGIVAEANGLSDNNHNIAGRGAMAGLVLGAAFLLADWVNLQLQLRSAVPADVAAVQAELAQVRGWLAANEASRGIRDAYIADLELAITNGTLAPPRPAY